MFWGKVCVVIFAVCMLFVRVENVLFVFMVFVGACGIIFYIILNTKIKSRRNPQGIEYIKGV